MLSWSRATVRKVEAIRDNLFKGIGTNELIIMTDINLLIEELGRDFTSLQWRKPLSIEEIARMADTPEVRERKGRP